MSHTDKHYIGLCGKAYQVRNHEGQRQIFHQGAWVPASTFVDDMARAQRWDILADLANAAQVLRPDEVTRMLIAN